MVLGSSCNRTEGGWAHLGRSSAGLGAEPLTKSHSADWRASESYRSDGDARASALLDMLRQTAGSIELQLTIGQQFGVHIHESDRPASRVHRQRGSVGQPVQFHSAVARDCRMNVVLAL